MTTQAMTQTIAEYFKTQPVLKAWFFGSYARGEERPDSNIDILVTLDRSTPHRIEVLRNVGQFGRIVRQSCRFGNKRSAIAFCAKKCGT